MDIKRLPDSELEIMQALWAAGDGSSRTGIEEHLTRSIAPTTVLTLLSRLDEKGFVRTEKSGRNSIYTALVSREEYLSSRGKSLVDLCGGNMKTFAAALVDSGISKDDLAELKKLLEENLL